MRILALASLGLSATLAPSPALAQGPPIGALDAVVRPEFRVPQRLWTAGDWCMQITETTTETRALFSIDLRGRRPPIQVDQDLLREDIQGTLPNRPRARLGPDGSRFFYWTTSGFTSVRTDGSEPPALLLPVVPMQWQAFAVSPDGAWVVFQTFEVVYGIPADGSSPAVALYDGTGDSFQPLVHITPDSQWAIYNLGNGSFDTLHSVRLDGVGGPVELTSSPLMHVDQAITDDSATLVFLDINSGSVTPTGRLRSVPVDGSSFATILNGPISGGDGVLGFELQRDTDQVLYWGNLDPGVTQGFFMVPADASAGSVQVADLDASGVTAAHLSHDGSRIYYLDGPSSSAGLYSVLTDGVSAPVLHSGTIRVNDLQELPDGRVLYRGWLYLPESGLFALDPMTGLSTELFVPAFVDQYQVLHGGKHIVALTADISPFEPELFRIRTDGLGTPRRLIRGTNPTQKIYQHVISSDESRVLSLVDRDDLGVFDIYQDFLRPPTRLGQRP